MWQLSAANYWTQLIPILALCYNCSNSYFTESITNYHNGTRSNSVLHIQRILNTKALSLLSYPNIDRGVCPSTMLCVDGRQRDAESWWHTNTPHSSHVWSQSSVFVRARAFVRACVCIRWMWTCVHDCKMLSINLAIWGRGRAVVCMCWARRGLINLERSTSDAPHPDWTGRPPPRRWCRSRCGVGACDEICACLIDWLFEWASLITLDEWAGLCVHHWLLTTLRTAHRSSLPGRKEFSASPNRPPK